jgi:hypothetical protein
MGDKHMTNFEIPDGLTDHGRRAAEIIRDFCREHGLTSGQRVFHTPAERSGDYGDNSELVVMHEGTDANRALSMDGAYEQNRGDYGLYEALQERLRGAGVYLEQCTRWCSAVYLI